MGLVSTLLFGYRVIADALGVTYPSQNRLRFMGAVTVNDDPIYSETIVNIGGASTSPTFGAVTATSLTLGPGVYYYAPAVVTSDGSTANLLPVAVAIPASGTLRIRGYVEAKILGYAHTYDSTWAFSVKWRRNGTAAPALSFAVELNAAAGEEAYGGVNGPPFADVGGATPGALSFTAAASGTGGVARLTLSATATGIASGCTATVSGSSVSAYNGTWSLTLGGGGTWVELRGSTYSSTATGTLTVAGSVTPTLSGNTGQLASTGILPATWITGEAVTAGAVRYAAGSGQTYIYTGNGTTSASPTGTTTGTDGSLPYEWHAAGRVCNVSWQVTQLEAFTT